MKYPTHSSTQRIVTYNYGTSGSIDDRLSRIAKLQHAGAGFVGTRDLSSYQHAGTGRLMDVRYLSASVSPEVYLDRGFSSGDYTNLDRFGRVKKQLWKTSSTTVDEFDYQHDLAGNRTSRDLPGNPLGQLYEYDGLDRLVDYNEGTISSGAIGSPTKGADWTLDGLGNWSGYEEQTAGSATLVQTRAHNKANEIGAITTTTGSSWITPLAHDAAGNLTEAPKPGVEAARFKYLWDAWNRLAKITTNSDVDVVIFQYDGLHRRIGKSEQPSSEVWFDNSYYLSEQDQVVQQFRYYEDTKLHWHEFVWHPYYVDAMAARFYNTSAISAYYYPLHDANFNVTGVVDKDAGVLERYHYTPYGRTTFMNASFTPHGTQNTTINQQHLYTGRQRDAESELYYYRARYYHPTLGRFVNRDPIGYDGGDLNLYRYVRNSPLVLVDPSGMSYREVNCTFSHPTKGIWSELVPAKNQETAREACQRHGGTAWRVVIAFEGPLNGEYNDHGGRYETDYADLRVTAADCKKDAFAAEKACKDKMTLRAAGISAGGNILIVAEGVVSTAAGGSGVYIVATGAAAPIAGVALMAVGVIIAGKGLYDVYVINEIREARDNAVKRYCDCKNICP